MTSQFHPLTTSGVDVIVGGALVLMISCMVAALVREARTGGNVPLWLLAFAVGGPISLLIYGVMQLAQPVGPE